MIFKAQASCAGGWRVAFLYYPVTIAMLMAVFIPFSIVINVLPGDFESGNPLSFILGMSMIGAIGAVIGYSVASLQRWLLRKYLYWTADNWRRYSSLGGAVGAWVLIGGSLLYEQLTRFSYDGMDERGFIFLMPIFIIVVAAGQWVALREAVKNAWLWILANFIGGIVFSNMITTSTTNTTFYNYGFLVLGMALLAILAQGFVTGMIMLWLFEKHSYEIEGESRNGESHTSSVWDQAI